MNPTVRLVRSPEDLVDAFDVRRDVFVDEQGVAPSEEWDGRDHEATHVVAYDGDRPVGTARLRTVDDGVGKVERVAVRGSHRGRGVGTALMDELESRAVEAGLETLALHAQTRVAEFYANRGYERSSDVFEEAGIDHVEMRRSPDCGD